MLLGEPSLFSFKGLVGGVIRAETLIQTDVTRAAETLTIRSPKTPVRTRFLLGWNLYTTLSIGLQGGRIMPF